jgi:phosphoglycerate-specific signal transduction histidine kinase
LGTRKKSQWLKGTSLTSQGARYHLKIAIALVVVLPMLSISLVMLSLFSDLADYTPATHCFVMVAALLCGLVGYTMLREYPDNLERMRDYLERIASDDLPESVLLHKTEQDSSDIERYLNVVVQGLHDKINELDKQLSISRELTEAVRKQSAEIVSAEQQRVMIESLGAACHHIGQPATVLRLYISRLRNQNPDNLEQNDILACSDAIESISDILAKLRHVSEYRTTPYATFSAADQPSPGEGAQIVDIDQVRPDELAAEV